MIGLFNFGWLDGHHGWATTRYLRHTHLARVLEKRPLRVMEGAIVVPYRLNPWAGALYYSHAADCRRMGISLTFYLSMGY